MRQARAGCVSRRARVRVCVFNRRTNDEWSRDGDRGCAVNRCIRG